jgi:hypothetical protein
MKTIFSGYCLRLMRRVFIFLDRSGLERKRIPSFLIFHESLEAINEVLTVNK